MFARQSLKADVAGSAELPSQTAAALGTAEAVAGLGHALGELALADGDAAGAAQQFTQALDLLSDVSVPYERAETELRAAIALAAAGERGLAIERLTSAYRAARRLGARPLAREAAEKLAHLGEQVERRLGRRAAGELEHAGLSRREVEVLRLVSVGRTNREIAHELFLSPRTIDMHALGGVDLVLTGRCTNRSGRPVAITPKRRRCHRILFRSFSHRDDHLGFLLEILGRQPLQTPAGVPKQRLPPRLLERRPAVPAPLQTRSPGDKLRTSGPFDERLDPRDGNREPGRLKLPVHLLGVFTSSCQESFSATSAAPSASSSSTHWLRARLSHSVPPGEQADRPAGPQHPPDLSQPSGGSRQVEQHEGHHHRVKGPICERKLGRVADQQREVPGTQGHHRLGSIQANDPCPRRHPVKVREQRSHPTAQIQNPPGLRKRELLEQPSGQAHQDRGPQVAIGLGLGAVGASCGMTIADSS
jgi:DNA-binding CsgD family transcriptional regulator